MKLISIIVVALLGILPSAMSDETNVTNIVYKTLTKLPGGTNVFSFTSGGQRTYFRKLGEEVFGCRIVKMESSPNPSPSRGLPTIERLVLQKGTNTFTITRGIPFALPKSDGNEEPQPRPDP